MKAKLGIAPIAWWNDDLAELSDDVSLEECLRQASVAGFTGMETGRRFPMDADDARPDPRALRHLASAAAGSRACCSTARSNAEKDRIARADGFLQGRRRALHRLWRDRALDPGRPLEAARDQAEALRGRDQGLRPQDDRVRRMVRRAGHAARLPSPHGGGDRDRAGARPLHEALGRGAPAALRRRPHGLRRRRRAARHRQAPRPHQPRPHQGRAARR